MRLVVIIALLGSVLTARADQIDLATISQAEKIQCFRDHPDQGTRSLSHAERAEYRKQLILRCIEKMRAEPAHP